MNRRVPGLETVKAIQGFLQFKAAEGVSVRTIESYSRDLRHWVENMGGNRSHRSLSWSCASTWFTC
jgi:hypothetical protein